MKTLFNASDLQAFGNLYYTGFETIAFALRSYRHGYNRKSGMINFRNQIRYNNAFAYYCNQNDC